MHTNGEVYLTHGYFIHEDSREQKIMKPYPPLGMLCISAWLEQHGVSTRIFDSTFSSFEKLCEDLILVQPKILGIYTNLMTRINVLKIIAFIRSRPELKKCRIILGGPEVRYHAEKFLQHGADIIVKGEGEETMLELCRTLSTYELDHPLSTLADKLMNVHGITFLNMKGLTIATPERVLLRDLDVLPIPDRKKIKLEQYLDVWKKRHGSSTVSVSTMRGCPYTCKWCSRAVYGQSYRRRSPSSVVSELKELKKVYAFDTIWFVDDVFTISHKWLEEFKNCIRAEHLHISYECITRADRLNDHAIQLLKESGCFKVWIGAESGSQKILDAMDRRVKAVQVQEMIKKAKSSGLETGTFIMVGYPGETDTDIEETIRHLKNADPDQYTITLTYPITGTELYQETEHKFLKSPLWSVSSDRDIDFRRSYGRKYYDFAIRRIYNEVSYDKCRKKNAYVTFRALSFRVKALMARAAMNFFRLFPA